MQKEKALNYCDLNDEEYQVFEDLDFSGKDTKRPAFQEMKKQIKAGLVKKVVVYRLDRLSRSLKDIILFIDLLKEGGVEFVSITEKFDTSTPMGRAMLNIMGVFAQMEREVISQRIKDSSEKQIHEGKKLGMPPFGYRLKVGKHGEWEIQKKEAEIVKKVFEMYSTGDWSYKSLASYLNKHERIEREDKPGQPTWGEGEYSSQGWQPWTVGYILKNPTYAGIIREDLEVPPKNFSILIKKELYEKCKRIRNKRSVYHPAYCHQTTNDYPLKGKVFCSCGFRMYGVKPKKAPHELYFWCRNTEAKDYHNHQPPLHFILDEVLSYLRQCKLSEKIIKEAKERLLKQKEGKEEDRMEMLKRYQESYQRLQEQYIDGAVSKKFMEKKSREIKDKIESLKPDTSSYQKAVLLSELPKIIEGLEKNGGENDEKYKKKLISLFVKKVIWKKHRIEKIEIYPELRCLFPKFKPREELSSKELIEKTGLTIYQIRKWNQEGVLPHARELNREKLYLKEESLKRIKKIKRMLEKNLTLWQIKKYLKEGNLLLSYGQIAKRLRKSKWIIKYRLKHLGKPVLKRNGVSYYAFKEVKEELKVT